MNRHPTPPSPLISALADVLAWLDRHEPTHDEAQEKVCLQLQVTSPESQARTATQKQLDESTFQLL